MALGPIVGVLFDGFAYGMLLFLLSVGLSATDYVGHGTGTEGAEMCMQMLALDRELGDFFARLDATQRKPPASTSVSSSARASMPPDALPTCRWASKR